MKLNLERLTQCRKALRITKLEAAKRVELSQPAYLRYESGERNPSIHVIHKMAEVFGTSMEYLTGESDDPSPNCYVVYRGEDELFRFIERHRRADEELKQRINFYMQKFLEEEIEK